MNEIYYFNNAATTWPKPECVIQAVRNYFDNPPINSARHCNCIKNKEDIDLVCKRKIAEFFHVDTDKYTVTITNGSTYSSNVVVNWLSRKYNNNIRLIVDNCAHNSIYRPHFEKIGTDPVLIDSWETFDHFDYDGGNYYAGVTHENNVDGTLLSQDQLKKIVKDLGQYNIPIVIDITQSAGTYDINVSDFDYDNLYFICSGHKGLFSTTGIGFLISPKDKIDYPFVSGGTGGYQGLDYKNTGSLEAGTPNELAMVSLVAGLDFINEMGLKTIRLHKEMLVDYYLQRAKDIKPEFKKYFEQLPVKTKSSGLICYKALDKMVCTEIISKLNQDYKIVVRSGVHCAPLFHINVLRCDTTLRISFGFFNKKSDIDYLIDSINKIVI